MGDSLPKLAKGLIFIVVFTFLSSCVKEFENPLDPESPNYKPPSVQILEGPSEGGIVSNNTVTFRWAGNVPKGNEFRYRLVGYLGADFIMYRDWTSWSTETSVTFDNLDDLLYKFELETRYIGQENVFKTSRRFRVEWITGPTVKFFKLKSEATVGSEFFVGLWIEEIGNFKSGSFKISFDKNIVEFKGVERGKFPQDNRLEQVIVPDFSLQKTLDEANNNGEINVATGVMLSSLSSSTDPPYLKRKRRNS